MAEIRVMREDLRPPAPPPKRHFISIKDVTREDVERLLATGAHVRAQPRA
jgi:aspartate carbamoyltransferase catalytic subunit